MTGPGTGEPDLIHCKCVPRYVGHKAVMTVYVIGPNAMDALA